MLFPVCNDHIEPFLLKLHIFEEIYFKIKIIIE